MSNSARFPRLLQRHGSDVSIQTITPIRALLYNTNIRPIDRVAIQQEYESYWLTIAVRNQGPDIDARMYPTDCDTFYLIAMPMYRELLQRLTQEAETNIFVRPACNFISTVIIRTILIYRLVEHYYRTLWTRYKRACNDALIPTANIRINEEV